MTVQFGWEHIFAGRSEPLGLIVEFDVAAQQVVSAWSHSTKRLLVTEELADLDDSICQNIDLAGGWDAFTRDFLPE